MNNLSALVIPTIKTPASPPPPGQVYVYFTPDGVLRKMDSTGIEKQVHLKKYEEQVSLTDSFNIIDVIDAETIEVEGDQTQKLTDGKLFVINGSSGGANDKLFTVKGTVLNGESTTVAVQEGGLATDLDVDGEVHIARIVTINHKLGTRSIGFHIRNFLTGDGNISVSNNTPDDDTLILTPQVPVVGSFLVTIVA